MIRYIVVAGSLWNVGCPWKLVCSCVSWELEAQPFFLGMNSYNWMQEVHGSSESGDLTVVFILQLRNTRVLNDPHLAHLRVVYMRPLLKNPNQCLKWIA